jgi:hypothetical protein
MPAMAAAQLMASAHANEVGFLMFRIKGSADLEFGEVFLGYLISPKSSPSQCLARIGAVKNTSDY